MPPDGAIGQLMLMRWPSPKISNFGDIHRKIGIKSHFATRFNELIPMSALDAIDRKILSLLQSDSRMTMQELADKVGLSVSPCHRRVKLLEESGRVTRAISTAPPKNLGAAVTVFPSLKTARPREGK